MRKTTLMIFTTTALGLSALVPASASMAPTSPAPVSALGMVHAVQYWGSGPYRSDDGWERRRQWREWREQRDEARIAEAARREAQMIQQEREERRAWRHAQREQQYGGYGADYGHQRRW